MRATSRKWRAVAACGGMFGLILILTACVPDQAPASAARTAAALRTPAATAVTTNNANTPSSAGPPATVAPASKRAATTAPAQGPASLKASPFSVPLQSGQMGTTTISWDTGQPDSGEVYVSENNEPETLFSSGSTGSQDAPWIKPDHTYVFRLYAGSAHSQVLATVSLGNTSAGAGAAAAPPAAAPTSTTTPRKPAAAADLQVEPNPVPADDQELGTAIVTWNVSGGGAIYVSQDDGPEQLFASGARGTEPADWICRGSTYEFRLYSGSAHADALKTVTVTRAEDAPDHEPPPVVECKGPPDQ
jgi:hypothetical protein